MFFVLVLVFLGLPLAELYVLLQVASGIGVLETIGVLVAVSVVGGWLVRREGVGVLRRIQRSLAAGDLPQRDVVDGGLILLAGALLVTPGFITDVLGILLLLPPTRAMFRAVALRALARRARLVVAGSMPGPFGPFGTGRPGPRRGTAVIDTTGADQP